MNYIDSNVFLNAILNRGPKGEAARKRLQEELRTAACTSCLTIDEVVWKLVVLTNDRNRAIRDARELFKLGSLTITPYTRSDSYTSLALMEKYAKLKPRDAAHVAIALRLGAEAIVSDDKDFDGVKELRREGV